VQENKFALAPAVILVFVYYEAIKREINRRLYMSVGVMRDSKLKLRDLYASHRWGFYLFIMKR
jgi:hypothetical protein